MKNVRKEPRIQIGSTADFEFAGTYYNGLVFNSSRSGLLIDLDKHPPEGIHEGNNIDIHLCDIFSDIKYVFPAKVIRWTDHEIAVEFVPPLTDSQNVFLDRWLEWQP